MYHFADSNTSKFIQTPHVLCTMEFAPKIDSPPHASNESTAGEGFAPAALPYENRLWRKKVLKVQLKNRHLLSRWRVDLDKFMECANRWSDGIVSKGSNHIPRFEMDDEDPDIVVELNGKLKLMCCKCLILCMCIEWNIQFTYRDRTK